VRAGLIDLDSHLYHRRHQAPVHPVLVTKKNKLQLYISCDFRSEMLQELTHMDRITQLQDELQKVLVLSFVLTALLNLLASSRF